MQAVPVTISVHANLRKYTRGKPSVERAVQPGATVGEVVSDLGVPRDQIHLVFVNHRAADFDSRLQGGERVDLFSAIGGG